MVNDYNQSIDSDLIDIEKYSFNGTIISGGGLAFEGSLYSDSGLCFSGKMTHDRQAKLDDVSFTGYLMFEGEIKSQTPISIAENSHINPADILNLQYKDQNGQIVEKKNLDHSINISGENISLMSIIGGRIKIEGGHLTINMKDGILKTNFILCTDNGDVTGSCRRRSCRRRS